MELSLPGLVGAAFGVGVGVLDFGIVASFVRQAMEKRGNRPGAVRKGGAGSGEGLLKVLFVINALVFAGLGYWFGAKIGG